MNFNHGQLLVEILVTLLLVSIILVLFINFSLVLQKSYDYQSLNENVAIFGFEKYRNILIALSKNNWSVINSLIVGNNYYFEKATSSWLIKNGQENVNLGSGGFYRFSFQIGNYGGNSDLKMTTISVEYLNLKFTDNFLIAKLKYASQ
ncbi:MAG: hypothetical protein KatS3mg097_248 [Candidatus Parcubacteria bacterium]|nr:MAG: hypothetical protein KatS3mg097_248 [Candidatus Parcubacteria bacterium]